MTTFGPMTHRGHGINPKPREPGIWGRILLRYLRREEGIHGHLRVPPSRIIREAGVSEASGYSALHRLVELGLLRRRLSDRDSLLRFELTPLGRRFRL